MREIGTAGPVLCLLHCPASACVLEPGRGEACRQKVVLVKRSRAWWGHVGRDWSRGNESIARVGEGHGRLKGREGSDPNPWKTRLH